MTHDDRDTHERLVARIAAGEKIERQEDMSQTYSENLVHLMTMQADSELAGAYGYVPWIMKAPTVEEKLVVAQIVKDEMRHATDEVHAIAAPSPRGSPPERALLGSPAHQDEARGGMPGRDPLERAEQESQVFLAVEPAHVEEQRDLGSQAEQPARRRAVSGVEAPQVDAGWQHLDRAAHALGPQPRCQGVRRRDDQVGAVGEAGAPADRVAHHEGAGQRDVMGVPVVERVVREDQRPPALPRQASGRATEQERVLGVEDIELEGGKRPPEAPAERQR